jgi:Replication initiation factor
MSSITKSVISGIDYLRLTAIDHKPYNDWFDTLRVEMEQESSAGRREHNRWVLGYYGRVGEHFFIGRSDAGCMVQVSSTLAHNTFVDLSAAGGRCTRVDLQITAPTTDSPDSYLHQAFLETKTRQLGRGVPPEIELRDTHNGAKMLTIGSRTSETYGRIYDKFKESGDERYMNMVRFEVEVKKPQSVDLHRWLCDNGDPGINSQHIVANWFAKRGVKPYWEDYQLMEPLPLTHRTKSDETRLAWIDSQVRPSMVALVKNRKHWQLARVLASKDASEDKVAELASLLLQLVGD